jgi:hypothetical protein
MLLSLKYLSDTNGKESDKKPCHLCRSGHLTEELVIDSEYSEKNKNKCIGVLRNVLHA